LQPKGIVRAGSANEWYPFEESQIAASIKLCKHLIQTYNLQPYNIVGHSDVAPGRKVDPGALFPWQRFAQEGIGAWPNFKESWPLPCFIEACNKEMLEEWLLKHLHLWGYKLPDKKTSARAIIQAFQLHFRQQLIDGKADLETAHILNALLCTYHLKKGEECLCQKSNKK